MASPPLAEIAQAFEQAVGLVRQGRLDEADRICSRIIKELPTSFDALHLLGVIKLQSGKAAAALSLFEMALTVTPDSPEALSNMALALAALHRDSEALAMFDGAHALMPHSLETLNNRGSLLLRLKRAAEALADFDSVLALEPRHAGARLNRGNALVELGRLDEAVTAYDEVLAAHPTSAETHLNRGNTLSLLGRQTEAIAAFDRALSLRSGYVKALTGRGAALQALNRFPEALAHFRNVLAIDKQNADAHHNEALVLLTLGDYRRGFEKYEYRWRRTGMPTRHRNLGKPLWLGEYPLARKTILVHAEQGLGDVIQFVRYVPMLARTGAKVVLEAPPELADLLARVEGVAAVVRRGETLPDFDVHAPVGSLPLAFKTEPSTIPKNVPYLKASDERIAKWRERIERLPSPRIAIAWAGNPSHANDRSRSIALSRLGPLVSRADVRFVSIQRELRSGDADLLSYQPELLHVGGELDDFDDTAAVVSLVDVVITVDTSVAHLAAALGRPTWIMVPFWPDWRWMVDREDSPWYPTARLFRQPAPGDWGSVIDKVQAALSKLV